jgi:hypothetical protein
VGALHRASAPCPSPGVSRAFSPGDEPASASPVADGWLGNTRGPVGQPRGCVPPTPSSHACHRAGAEETNNPCPQGRGQLRRCGGRCVRGSGTDARVAVRRFTACAHLWWVSDCWRNGADRPVLKHGPRSLTRARVSGWQTWARSESRGRHHGRLRWEGCKAVKAACSAPPADLDFLEGFEPERTRWDPKDCELWVTRMKPEETLVEVRSDTDVQIVHLSCL